MSATSAGARSTRRHIALVSEPSCESGPRSKRVEIRPATLRDLTYIAVNMRDSDWREIACQVPAGTKRSEVGARSLSHETWTAHLDGQPVAAFGVVPATVSVLLLWAWGTTRMRRTIPAISRFVNETLAAEWVERGITRVEARSIVGHEEAHRWMRGFGAQEQPCPGWGSHGEAFILFWWNYRDWRLADGLSRDPI